MAELPNPSNQRRPIPRFGQVDRANPIVESGDIAIGQATSAMGSAIAQFGSKFGNYLIREQARQNRITMEKKTFDAQQVANGLKTEYEQVKGADVAEDKDFFPNIMARYDEQVNGLMEDAENIEDPEAREMLSLRLKQGRANFELGLIKHVTAERGVYETDVYQGGIKVAQDTMASNYNDPAQVLQARNDIERLTKEYADPRGISGDALDAAVKQNLTEGHISVIQRAVDSGDIGYAKEYYAEFGSEIEGDKHDDIDRLLKTAGIKANTQAMVDGMWDKYRNDPAAGRKYIRDNASPEERDEALRRFENRLSEVNQDRSRVWDANGTQARDIYAKLIDRGVSPTDAYDAIPESVLDNMKPSERMSLQAVRDSDASGKTVKTDPVTYFELSNWIEQNPGQEIDLAQYRYAIAFSDLKTLETKMRKDPNLVRTETQIVGEGLLTLDIDPKELGEKGDKGDKARSFRYWVEQEAKKVPDYSEQDLADIVERGVLKIKRDPKGWAEIGSWFGLVDTETPAYLAEVPGVPRDQVSRLAELIAENGQEVTETAIQDLHLAMERERRRRLILNTQTLASP